MDGAHRPNRDHVGIGVGAVSASMLFGRDRERALIGTLLEAARDSRSGALVVRGEPGVGKSALLLDARDRAADMHFLSARGVESECELPFAALDQLLRPALRHLDRLPGPQAAALGGALGLEDRAPDQRFLVFAGCLSLLSELAERRPVLCLVDDAHWLDAASADALRFVARRLDAEGIVMLFGAREGEVRTFEADDVRSLLLEGLDTEAATALLKKGAGVDPAPSVRDRLVEQTRGNPLALLEVPSALTRAHLAGEEPLPEALPMTRQVERIFLERFDRLPEESRRLLLIAAADDSEDAALVATAFGGIGVGVRALDAAEQAGLVTVNGTRLQFRHPLVRSAVYDAAVSSDRRAAHRALAEALAGDAEQADRRAWHLAASVLEHDEGAVRALDEAATRAEERAGFMAAAKALERAAALSADGTARGQRLVRAARAASTAGADDRAVALAKHALHQATDPVTKAEIVYVLGLADIRRGRPLDGLPALLEAAAEVAAVDSQKALELLMFAMWAASDGGDVGGQLEASRLASRVAHPEDDWSSFVVHYLEGCGAMAAGDSARGVPLLEEAIGWALASDDERVAYWAGAGALWLGDDERAGELARRAANLARKAGAVGVLTAALGICASQLFLAQQFDEASLAAAESLQLARELRADNLVPLPLGVLAGVAAIRGQDDEARRHAEETLELARAHGLVLRAGAAMRALALIDLGRGRWSEALDRLAALAEVVPGHGVALVAAMTGPDRIEAAVRGGHPEQATEALSSFEEWAAHSSAPWVQPRLASCRALLAEGDEATEHYEEALQLSEDARPFDLPRIQLLFGEHLRRERRRTDSRVQLRAALEGFERLRAEPWAERTRTELRASGERARKRDPSTVDELTQQELQIARFVAEGLSNKEVAAQLFLSPRTIDYHLRNVFTKLGIKSRTQLARMSLGEPEPVELSMSAALRS